MSLDFPIGRGDNEPVLTWAMPFAVAGSDFDLVITTPLQPGSNVPPSTMTLTVSGGDLTLDTVANTVTWPVTSAQSAALSYTNFYTLRRIVLGGEIRYYAQGRIFGVDGPVGTSSATVQVAGPQGEPGQIGPGGANAYQLAGGDAVWGSLAAWLSSPATPQQALSLYVGDVWRFAVTISDPHGLLPNGLAGSSVTGLFYVSQNASPVSLTVANGGVVILDPVNRIVLVSVSTALTTTVTAGALGVRVTVVLTDSSGNPQTLGSIPVTALSR